MARKKGRSVSDVSRYTGTRSSVPPSFGSNQDDDTVTSGVTFTLIAIVVFLAICFAAVRFGTQNIESDIETRASSALAAAGFSDVTVEANGTTVLLSGSFTADQNDDDAHNAVAALAGVGSVEGQIWLISTEDLADAVVRGTAFEAVWENGIVVVNGELSSEEKINFVKETLEDSEVTPFVAVNVEGLTVKDGLVEETWLGPILGLLQSVADQLPIGLLRADGANKLVAVSGEVLEKSLRDELNDAVLETASALGFSPTPGVLLLDIQPTEEEVEELQEDLNELILDQVVEFEIKSFLLTEQGTALLDEVITALESAPEGITVIISGHTDDRGPDEENQLLSEQRAQAVLDYLVTHGQDRDRLEAIGFGESQPVESNATRAGRARNRRIEFTAVFVVQVEGEDQ
jgi:outer membrane protein OmpA-like peptidoglycan-associated protein